MFIDTYTVSKLVRLRAGLQPDEKIVARGYVLDVVKKSKWEMWIDKTILLISTRIWHGMVKK